MGNALVIFSLFYSSENTDEQYLMFDLLELFFSFKYSVPLCIYYKLIRCVDRFVIQNSINYNYENIIVQG